MSNGKEKPGFFETVLAAGMLLSIWGKMRAGKSNLIAFIMEKAIEKGYYIYTNMHFFRFEQIKEAMAKNKLLKGIHYRRKPQEIVTVTKCSQLLKKLFKTEKNITVLDETALFASSSMGTSKKVRWLKALTFTIGKLDSSLVLIAQDKGSVIPALRKTLVSYEMRVKKRGARNRWVDIYIMPEEVEDEMVEPKLIDTWYRLQPTKLPFDSKGLVKFEFDIDIEDFFNRIAEYNSLDAITEAPRILEEMLKELEEDTKKKAKGKTSKKDLIMTEFYNKTKLNLRALATKYETSYQNVKNIHADFLRENETFGK